MMHLILEGIDGSGKGTLVRVCIETLEPALGPVFDVPQFSKEHHRLPLADDFKNHKLIFTAEPTYAWIGSALREELTRRGARAYSPHAIAESFALDRLIHYQRIIIPARAAGCTIIQERSVVSSLAYQSLTHHDLTLQKIAALEGNTLALAHPPTHLFILSVSPEKAIERLTARMEKQDHSLYERKEFLERLAAQYQSQELRAHFDRAQTAIIDFPTDEPLDIIKARAQALIAQLMHS